MEKQVDRERYTFKKYLGRPRWNSIFSQLELMLDENPTSLLEVGPAIPIFGNILKTYNPELNYKTLDIAEDLEPDYLGSVDAIPLADNSFDIVCAFQVLEHLPYGMFVNSLKEMRRVSKGKIMISIPHYGPQIKIFFQIPKIMCKWLFKIPKPKKHVIDDQHYWELGKKEYSIQRIEADIAKVGKIVKKFTLWENPNHRFYVIDGGLLVSGHSTKRNR